MNRVKGVVISVVVIVCIMFATVWDGYGAQKSEGPIKIGMTVALTGYVTEYDTPVLAGAKLAVASINKGGGILGRNIELVAIDMQSDPQQGVQALLKLITRDNIVASVNGFSSAAAISSAPIAIENKVPIIVCSIMPPEHGGWVYSTIPPAHYETGLRIDYLKSIGTKTISILYDSSPYAAVQLKNAKDQLKVAGIELLAEAKHSPDVTDLRSQMSNLLDSKPGAILKFGGGPSSIVAATALKQLNCTIPILLSVDNMSIFTKAGAQYSNLMFTAAKAQVYDALNVKMRSTALTTFITNWRIEKANVSLDPTYPGRGWDGIFIVANAIKKTGSTDGQKIRDEIEITEYDGVSANFKYTKDNRYGYQSNPLVLAKFSGKDIKIVYMTSR